MFPKLFVLLRDSMETWLRHCGMLDSRYARCTEYLIARGKDIPPYRHSWYLRLHLTIPKSKPLTRLRWAECYAIYELSPPPPGPTLTSPRPSSSPTLMLYSAVPATVASGFAPGRLVASTITRWLCHVACS